MDNFVKKGNRVVFIGGLIELSELQAETDQTKEMLELFVSSFNNSKYKVLTKTETEKALEEINQEQWHLTGLLHSIKRLERRLKASKSRDPVNIRKGVSCIANLQ